MAQLFTTLGPRSKDQPGMVLPREHVFVDPGTPGQPGHAARARGVDEAAITQLVHTHPFNAIDR